MMTLFIALILCMGMLASLRGENTQVFSSKADAHRDEEAPEDMASLLQHRGDLHATSQFEATQEPEKVKEQRPDGAHVFCPGGKQCILEEAPQAAVSSGQQRSPVPQMSAPLLCPADQFQSGGLVFPCAGQGPFEAEVPLTIPGDDVMTLQFLPAGVLNLGFTVFLGGEDPDTRLINNITENCIVGFGCSPCGSGGCTDEEYEGMLLNFNGDSFFTGNPETTNITGPSTVPLELAVRAFGVAFSSSFYYRYDGIEPCPEVPPGCSTCGSFRDCPADALPQCNGTAEVGCEQTCVLLCSALGCGSGHGCVKSCQKYEEKVFAVLDMYPAPDSDEEPPRPCQYCKQLCSRLKYPHCYKSCLKNFQEVREVSQLYAEVHSEASSADEGETPEDMASLLQAPLITVNSHGLLRSFSQEL